MALEKPKRANGRPSEYRAEYCQKLIDWMSEGRSFETFGTVVDVDDDTLNQWVIKHPAFAEAKAKAKVAERQWWETVARGAAAGKIKNSAQAVLIFSMKNKFPQHYNDRRQVELTGAAGGPVQFSNMTEEQIRERIKAKAAMIAEHLAHEDDGDGEEEA